MSTCFLPLTPAGKASADDAFMGKTHVLTGFLGFSIALALTGSLSRSFWHSLLESSSGWVLLLFALNYFGSTLPADLDNTASTSKSSMGVLGDVLSVAFRGISTVVQSTVRLKRDDKRPNPHRGFFHTIPASLLMGLGVFLLTRLGTPLVKTSSLGVITYGWLSAFIISSLLLNMMLAAVAKKQLYRLKKKAGIFSDLVPFIVSFTVTFLLFINLPQGLDFRWLGLAVFAGNVTHIVGDTFTTAGTPLLFPLPVKGKMWWMVRIFPLHVGEEAEKVIAVLLMAASGGFALLDLFVWLH